MWDSLSRTRHRAFPVVLISLNLVLTIYVAASPLQKFPNAGDEYAYLISAEIFSRGKLSVPSPALPEFFDVVHVVNDGRFYGKYPPGWPLLLAAGELLGVPWLVNPLIGAAIVFVVWWTARRHFSTASANIALLMSAANPFIVFNAASYFSHPSCLLFLALFYLCLFDGLSESGTKWSWAAMGLFAGLAFLIRPFTAVAFLAPAAGFLLYRTATDGRVSRAAGLLVIAVLTFGVCLAVFLGYNYLQTGNAFLQPFAKYDPIDAPAVPPTAAAWATRFDSHVRARLLSLGLWLPLSPLLALSVLAFRDIRSDRRVLLLLLSAASLFAAYFFYWGDGIIQYGPRYIFEATGALVLLSALAIERMGRAGAPALAVVLLMNLVVFARAHESIAREIREKKDLYDRVEERKLSSAIVFLRTGSGGARVRDCVRNGIDFDGPVLYVYDRGRKNASLMEAYPGRVAWSYRYDRIARRGDLRPLARPSVRGN